MLADSQMSYGMLFIVGLLTSVHCIAMCGGIHLSQCIPSRNAENTSSSRINVIMPSVLYNAGRVVSYTAVGFVLGGAGMILTGGSGSGMPLLLQGILKITAGLFMVIMGINMLGIFPALRKLQIRFPRKSVIKINQKKRTEKRPFVVGLLNGFMPCGPMQSMQIIALGLGNPISGALAMLMFSLGTVPLMLGLGSLVSALGEKYTKLVMQTGAMAKKGELFVLDMGKPVRIYDLAVNMIKLSGLEPNIDIKIEEVGLRPGEKLYEELLMKTEHLTKTENNMIFIEKDVALSRSAVDEKIKILNDAVAAVEAGAERSYIRYAIANVVPTFHEPNEINCAAESSDEMKKLQMNV